MTPEVIAFLSTLGVIIFCFMIGAGVCLLLEALAANELGKLAPAQDHFQERINHRHLTKTQQKVKTANRKKRKAGKKCR